MGYCFRLTLNEASNFWKFHLGMAYALGFEILVMIIADSGTLGYVGSCIREWVWKNQKGFKDVFKRNS